MNSLTRNFTALSNIKEARSIDRDQLDGVEGGRSYGKREARTQRSICGSIAQLTRSKYSTSSRPCHCDLLRCFCIQHDFTFLPLVQVYSKPQSSFPTSSQLLDKMRFYGLIFALLAAITFAQQNVINNPVTGWDISAGSSVTITWTMPSSGTVSIRLTQGGNIQPGSGDLLICKSHS